MGNSQSSDHDSKSAQASPISPAGSKHHVARRKESAHALFSAKSAPPPASLISSSSASAAVQPTRAHAHATVPASSHTRARSITASSGTTKSKVEDSTGSHQSDSSTMGSEQSKQQRPPSARSTPLPTPASIIRPIGADAPADEKPTPSPSSARPVDVPQAQNHQLNSENFFPAGPPSSGSPYGLPPSNYSRPPRLPLPIEEEIHTPGSPIIRPEDLGPPIEHGEPDGLRRRTSVLSSTTVDDEDIGDQEAFSAEESSIALSVPTKIEWNGYGEKVYVTGTFVQWDRKFKLHRDKEKGRGFCATLPLKPGTHHIKFLVDGDMITANDLPTTVDYTNILVNYIEVVASMPSDSETQPPAPAVPMPIPGSTITQSQATGTAQPAAKLTDTPAPAHAPETEADISPSTVPPATANPAQPMSIPQSEQPSRTDSPSQETQQPKPSRQLLPRAKYTNQIPQFLLDLDTYNDPGNERFQRSSRVVNILPQPPSLPMFLGKSILNGATPHKDDASVLIMPNHTVLNHLATSSIKNNVLATSGTTRYKRKFLTTIMYRPTGEDT